MKQFPRPAQASRKYFYFLIGKIGMRFSLQMGILLVLLLGLCVPAYSTILNGCLVTPGSTITLAGCDATTAPFGTLLASLSAPFTSTLGTFSGTLKSAVYRESGGTLDFYYQFTVNTTAGNASGAGGCGHGGGQPACDPIARETDTNFSTLITNLAFRTDGSLTGFFTDGTVPPVTGDRNSPVGDVIGFSFSPPDSAKILPGSTSNILIISTNATNFKAGNASVIDGGTVTVASFAPVAGAGVRGDFTGDGKADLVWRNDVSGDDYLWAMNGTSISSTAPIMSIADPAWKIVGSGDFDGDRKTDLLWRRDGTGENYIWLMNGPAIASAAPIVTVADTNWKVVAVADFTGDGKADIFWRNIATGENYLWIMNGTALTSATPMPTVADLNWKVVGTGDLNGDGKYDLVWRRDGTGDDYVWLMNGASIAAAASITTVGDANWKIVGVGDFDGDGKADLFWRRDVTGENYLWTMNGTTVTSLLPVTSVADANWKVVGVGDFDGDGKMDLFWRRDVTGDDYVWLMNGAAIASSASVTTVADSNWKVVAPR